MSHDRGLDWVAVLPFVICGLNSSPNKATKISPHLAIFGRKPNWISPISSQTTPNDISVAGYSFLNRLNLEGFYKIIKVCQEEANLAMDKKLKLPSETFKIGDQVRLYRPQSVVAKETKMPYIGPYTIIQQNDFVAKIRGEDGNEDWVSKRHLVNVPDRPSHLIPPPPFNIQIKKTGEEHSPP